MKQKWPSLSRWLAVMAILGFASSIWAQQKADNPEARTAYTKGVAAREKGDLVAAAAAFKIVIDLQPDNIDANIGYIDAVVRANRNKDPRMTVTPTQLVEMYGQKLDGTENRTKLSGVYLFARGMARAQGEAKFLGQACTFEPKVVEYLVQQAREEKDPETILYYARAFSLKAPVEYRDTLRRTVTRFPRSKAALAALMFLAQDAERNKDRVQILQRIRTEFAAFAPHATEAQKRVYSGEKLAAPAPVLYNGVMKDFFELMAKSNPAAALALAQEMVKANPQDEQWAATVEVQQGLVRAKSALAGGRLQDATETLKPFSSVQSAPIAAARKLSAGQTVYLRLLNAELAIRSGNPAPAYEELRRYMAAFTSKELKDTLYRLGDSLGKSREQVDREMLEFRVKQLKQRANTQSLMAADGTFKDFELETYDGRKVKLSDLRGKVVLLSFWYPT